MGTQETQFLEQILKELKTGESRSPGDTVFSRAVGVAPSTSVTVVSHSPSSTRFVGGFDGNGESDGRWILYINGQEKATAWTNQSEPNAETDFGNPIKVEPADTITLEVQNVGLHTASYNGTIFIML